MLLEILYRTRYTRTPKHIVPRITDETKQNFFLAVMEREGFATSVHGDEVTPSLSQSEAISKCVVRDITRKGKRKLKIEIQLSKLKKKGMVRHQLAVVVTHNEEQFHYQFDSRGNSI